MKRTQLLRQIQEYDFAVNELTLYLDTHRDDREALELYQQYQQMYHECLVTYTGNDGPLNHRSPTRDTNYRWLQDPWPWEYAANKEV